jgi:hypothetical protein
MLSTAQRRSRGRRVLRRCLHLFAFRVYSNSQRLPGAAGACIVFMPVLVF